MQINLTGHHVDITDPLRDYVHSKMDRVIRHFDNLIDVHMKNLRRKIDPPDLPALVQTVRGQGFRLSTPPDHHV